MDTPSEHTTRADHRIDWDDVEARHHPVTLVSRPVYEGWLLGLFGAILVGFIGLLAWTGYALSPSSRAPAGASIRRAVDPRSTGHEAIRGDGAAAHEMDQRLHAWRAGPGTRRRGSPRWSSVPGNTWPSRRRRFRPAARHPTAPQCHQCAADPQDQQATATCANSRGHGALGAPRCGEFWSRWLRVASGVGAPLAELSGSGQPSAYLYHITYKSAPQQR